MAFVVDRTPREAAPGARRRFEVRESVVGPNGPRARTLATFTVLDEVALAKARARALRPFREDDVAASARRLGAPVAVESPAEGHARALLGELRAGRRPPPVLAALLRAELETDLEIDDNVEAASEWIGASDARRGTTLVDLLELADAIPLRRRPDASTFPRISSR
jgi:hypothetical protein